MSGSREHDERTGRPRVGPFEAIASLSDRELDSELLMAAAAPDHRRYDRFERLLQERERRRRREDLVLVVVSGALDVRAVIGGELARLLGAAYLKEAPVRAAVTGDTEKPDAVVGAILTALADVNLRSGISVVIDPGANEQATRALGLVQRNNPSVPVVEVEAVSGVAGSPDRLADYVWDRARANGG